MGSWRGNEHCEHCANLTISRASFEASNNPSAADLSISGDTGLFGSDFRRGRELVLRGREDMNVTWSSQRSG